MLSSSFTLAKGAGDLHAQVWRQEQYALPVQGWL